MNYGKYTIVFRKEGISYKLCKIWFGRDGSYYVTSPYHPEHRAFVMKIRVNYSLQETTIALEDAIDTAGIEDDNSCLKLSHHPDGLVQFSGHGILSGRDADGNIRGFGVMSWPLDRPVLGPAFSLLFRGVEQLESAHSDLASTLLFTDDELTSIPNANTLYLEGFYFPGLWRRFIRIEPDGTRTISVLHPAKAIVKLKVLFASDKCERDGFIGLELYTDRVEPTFATSPSFALTGSTGNVGRNLQGQVTADSIQCMYPRGDLRVQRMLEYMMPEVEST
ncbi:hypothetical protein HUU05_07245 [candidate division KSB1 bacterium]|nr:hypothetical protein [candidate division KSB1 bacterium]